MAASPFNVPSSKTVFYSKTVPVQTVKIAIDFNLNELS